MGLCVGELTQFEGDVLISVIIPHFERMSLLLQTMASLQQQSYRHWEAIIVDDGSAAPVWQQLQELRNDRVRVLRREDGVKGPSRCRNLGLQAARGEYVLFLDSDDLLGPDCLQARMAAVQRHPDSQFWVFPVQLFHQQPGDCQHGWNVMTEAGDDLERFLRSDGPWCVSSSFWRLQALTRLGGFNELVMYGDDADLHIRALLSDLPFRQMLQHSADVFIRRSDAPRITGGQVSDTLLRSRLERLTQVWLALKRANSPPRLLQLWQSQYFMEGEFLLYNRAVGSDWLGRLCDQWQMQYPLAGWRRRFAVFYLRWAAFWRDRWYLQVRLARRAAMLLLPAEWFPVAAAGGGN